MKIAVGHSADPSLDHAVEEILSSLRDGVGDAPPVAALVFACIEMDHEDLLSRLADALPGVALIGCTTDGELSNHLQFQEDSVTVTLIAGEGLYAQVGAGRSVSVDPVAALDQLTGVLADHPLAGAPRLVITLPEGLSRCGADVLVSGLNERLAPGTPVVGGTAGDQWAMKRTYQFVGTETMQDSLPVLALFGAITVGVGVSSGWAPLGHRGLVTSARGSVVHTIDGLPAIQFYQRYLGPHTEMTPEYPLGVFVGDATSPFLRAPISGDTETGSVAFTGDIPEGALVQISETVIEELLDACRRSVSSALEALGGRPPVGALVFSCAARKQLLGTRTARECEILTEHVATDLPVAGFYTYGEIAPMDGRTIADFHNETFVTVLLADEQRAVEDSAA